MHNKRDEGFFPRQLALFEKAYGQVKAKRLNAGIEQFTKRPVVVFRAPGGRLFFRMSSLFREVEEQHLLQAANAAGLDTPPSQTYRAEA